MDRRGRAIGEEHAETEAQTIALNESLARDEARRARAVEHARKVYETDDVEIVGATGDLIGEVDSVDGGYWVAARVWVDADDAEPTP